MTNLVSAAGVETAFHLPRKAKLLFVSGSVAAVGLRVWHLDAALWYDEAFSAWLSQLPLGNLLTATLGDVHPPAYYLLLWAVNHAWGHSEAVLRLPSLLAGLGLILVVAKLGLALGLGQKAVWLATAITALSPFQVYYSQEARAYALLSLAVAVAALGLVERRGWLAVARALGALYLHNLAGVFLLALWLASFICDPPGRSHLARTGLILSLGYLPGLAWLIFQAGSVGSGYWIPPLTSPGRLLATLDDLLWFAPENTFVLATALITALGLAWIGADLVTEFKTPARIANDNTKFLAMATFTPLILVALASVLWQPVLISRVMAPAAPVYYLLLSRSVTRWRRRMFIWLGLALPTAGLILVVGPLLGSMGRQPLHRDLISLYGQYRPGDALYHANVGSYVVWNYYRPDIPQFLWPQPTTLAQTLSGQTRTAMGMHQIDFELIKCVTLVSLDESQQIKRWWLIYFHNPTTDPAEMAYVERLVSRYPSKKIKRLRSDSTVEAWLVLIEPDCPASGQKSASF